MTYVIGKAEMRFRGIIYIFQFSKTCLHFSAVCLQYFKKMPALKRILDLLQVLFICI